LTNDIEERLNNLLSSLSNRKIEETIETLEVEIKKLILHKKILYLLYNIDFSLKKLKENLNLIHKNSRELNLDVFKLTKKITNELKNELNKQLIVKNNQLKQLLESWNSINEIFNHQNISKENFEMLFTLLDNINNIDNKLSENTYLPSIINILKNEIEDFKKRKDKTEENIRNYLISFSDQDFVLSLIKGKKLLIKDLNPKIYNEIYNSPLGDKITISLRRG